MRFPSFFPTILVVASLASCASRSPDNPRLDLLGDPSPLAAATQTIVITPETKWVNVTGGETVKFIVGDQAFAWNFGVAQSVSSFPLNQVAPAGLMNRKVMAYVAPDPRYTGNSGSSGSAQ